jgi:putative MATE family efflux protein
MKITKDKNNQKALLSLAIPIFFELLLVTIVGNVDIIMLGKLSDRAVSTVGGMSQVLNMQNTIFGFISLGTTILISQYIGAKNKKNVHEIITVSLILNLVIGLLLGIVYYLFCNRILLITKLPEDLIPLGINYFKLVGGLCIFQSITLTCGAIMKSYGMPTPMLCVNIGVNLLNIIGNAIFIFGWFGMPVLGVTGVGLSTVISRGIGCVVAVFVTMNFCRFKFRRKFLNPFPFNSIKKLLFIGIPSAGENLCWNIAQLAIVSMVNNMGESYIAARTYMMLLASFVMTFSISLGQGTAIQVGQLIGAKKIDEAYKKCFSSLVLSLMLAFFVMIGIILFKKPIMSMFTQDPVILKIAYKLFPIMLLVETGRVFNIIIIRSLQATGDIKFPTILGIIFMFGIAVNLSYFLGMKIGFGLVGIWIANAADEWLRGLAMLFRWKSKKWITKSFV